MGLVREGNSELFKKIDPIIDLICEEIDNDQKLKRLLFYLTKSPLLDVGKSYSGDLYYQRDLSCSLMKPQKIDVSKNNDGSKIIQTEQILYKSIYQGEKITEKKPLIFVYNDKNQINKRKLTEIDTIMVDILVPYDSDQLIEKKRIHEIMIRIGELFHNAKTDNETSKIIGDLTFSIADGNIFESKITKSTDINIVSIPIEVVGLCVRGYNDGGIC